MLFHSYIFLFLFFPLCILGYYLFNHFHKYEMGKVFIILMSLIFYSYHNISLLFIIGISIIANYGIHTLFHRAKNRKLILILGLIFNIGFLFYFKYYNFFLENINFIFHTNIALKNILLPLGISFYTFQQIAFIVDSYRNKKIKYSFIDYTCFVTFFPQLIAGPIVKHHDMIPQFNDKKRKIINYENIAKGIYIFTIGLAKKILIADVFAVAVNVGFDRILQLSTNEAIIIMLGYTFQLYFDFSGYCDMAIGIGKMLNIDLPVNFNSPYKAYTIDDFWHRWNITLTNFFTEYVYYPLGGSKKGKTRTIINIMIVFLLSGLWHGANYSFLFFGFIHGINRVITKFFKKQIDSMHKGFQWILNFTFINIGFLFFRANNISDAFTILHKILQFQFGSIYRDIRLAFCVPEVNFLFSNFKIYKDMPYLPLFFFFCLSFFIILGCKNSYEKMEQFKPNIVSVLWIAFLLFLSILSFQGLNVFIYYNF